MTDARVAAGSTRAWRPMTSLHSGAYTAQITAVGAAMCGLQHDGRELLYREDAAVPTPPFAGAVLAPWPNRIAGGNYRFGGLRHQLPVDEVGRGNALHGLGLWQRWRLLDEQPDSVSLELELWPRPGYPFAVTVRARYTLDDAGLHLRIEATNTGDDAAPIGLSGHPYLTVGGDSLLDEWTFRLPCDTVLLADDRLLPRRSAPVDAAGLDFRLARPIGATELDHAFTGVAFTDGRASAELVGPDGAGVRIGWDTTSQWVQVYTVHAPGRPSHRRAVAIEPMTCAPNAFNSGDGLITLAAEETTTTGFDIAAVTC